MNGPNGAIVLPNAQQQMMMNAQLAAMRAQFIVQMATPMLAAEYALVRQKAHDEAQAVGGEVTTSVTVSNAPLGIAAQNVDQILVGCGLVQGQ